MEAVTEKIEVSRIAAPRHTAARAMLQALADRGVRIAFGIPGGLVSPFFDALAEVPEIEIVSTRHEAMAAFAAMGYAAATGRPAIVITTGGPGITNAITGVAAALAEELPMIVIAGDVPQSARSRGAIQDSTTNAIDVVAMMRTVTRWSVAVERASQAGPAAEQAFRTATGARPGPVFLSIPLDVGNTPIAHSAIAMSAPAPARPDLAACATVAAALAGARRPLLVVGNGARSAAAEIRLLAERLTIPVVTTPHAKGVFPESHRLHLGGIGFGGHTSASEYLASRPDVVCILGSRLGDTATNGWTLPITGAEATFQIDREASHLGRNYPLTLGVVADCAEALRAIDASLPSDVAKPQREFKGIRRIAPAGGADVRETLHPARVLELIQLAFPRALFTSDQGEHCAFAVHYLTIDEPGGFRAMVGLGSMGSGIGGAIGTRCARPDREVVAICGDGGLAMYAGEILTCAENGIGVLFVVFNDGRWNMIHHGFQAVYGRRPRGLPAHVADLAETARGLGAIGVRIDDPSALAPEKLRPLLEPRRPVVLDVRIDAEVSLSAATRSASLRKSAFGGAL
ncbi:MAG TPA: thiamine pyrophosphate-binding protein [Polyangiaceae bacterium]|jgi:acetolactate synthase-1/2/3 large subunit